MKFWISISKILVSVFIITEIQFVPIDPSKKDITYCHDILIWFALEIIRKKASIVRNCYTIRYIGSDEEEEAINSRRRGRTSYINLLFGTMTYDRDYARY